MMPTLCSLPRALALAALLGATLGATACPFLYPDIDDGSRDRDDDDDDDDDDDGASCSREDDCDNIACLCDDGSALGMPVNTRSCNNGRCETPSQACPDSCSTFNYTWTGSTVGSDDGGGCTTSSDCPSHYCDCPDGTSPEIRDCWDGVCYGPELCADQCCALGHC